MPPVSFGARLFMITVKMSSPRSGLTEAWSDLVTRASPNVFMNPVVLKAAQDNMFATVHMLCAWDDGAATRKLVGLWALQERQLFSLGPAVLEALPYEYAFLSNPVVDPAYAEEVMVAFFAAIRSSKSLPRVVSLKQLDAEAPSYRAMRKIFAEDGNRVLELGESLRPVASPETGVKKSGSTRKKLRQDWNRLSALGAVDIVNVRDGEAAKQDFETFLTLESASWKGAEGTALLSSAHDALFVRRMFSSLAERREASVALLRVDGRAIAAQVLMYCGKTAFTWKTAFNAEFGKFSPGALLIDKVTEELFAGAGIEAIDSCSVEGSFMANLWTGRRAMIDIVVNVSPTWSTGFALEAMHQIGLQNLRQLRDRMRAMSWLQPGKKAGLAVAR